jgi:hypothetical protein
MKVESTVEISTEVHESFNCMHEITLIFTRLDLGEQVVGY